uniref:CXXC-type zinc finger protein 1 n=1 Tax=Soboliphyme baturini TaxID=241478 RepID=A0A183IVW8_9BILA
LFDSYCLKGSFADIREKSQRSSKVKKLNRHTNSKKRRLSHPASKGMPKHGHSGLENSRTRASSRKLHEFMMEAGVENPGTNDNPKTARQCYGPQCVYAARPGSNYCSDECGMKLARKRILEILPGRIQSWNINPSVAERFERRRLEVVCEKAEEARKRLASLDFEEKRLSEWINEAAKLKANPDDEANDKCENQTSYGTTFRATNTVYNLFCEAYNKSNGTYCKRLRIICPEHCKDVKADPDEICGCPLNLNDTLEKFSVSASCQVAKRNCTKHCQWEKIRRGLIDQDRLTQLLRLDELYEEERFLKASICSRGNLMSLLLHQTTQHEQTDMEMPIGDNA